MESLLKNLKKQVTCSICLDTYTKPKTIACLHTFCLECLKEHALTSQRQGKYRCPDCQEEIGIPEGNRFDNLPTSFLHNRLLSLLSVQQIGNGKKINCGICKKKSAAEISYCFDCEKLLCPDCVNAHDAFQAAAAAFEGHKVTPVKQFQAQDYETLLKGRSFCSQKYHEREVTKFYCLECQNCVCQICINTEHKNHKVDPLEKAVDREKANIMADVELMKEKRKVYSNVMHQLEETASKLEDNVSNAISEVSQVAEEMIAKIRESEQEAITALKNAGRTRTEKLDDAKKQVQSSTKQIRQAVAFAKNLALGSLSLDIMQSKENLKQRFADLNKTPVPSLPVSPFVKFVSTISPESLSLGFIATSETDVRLSTEEGLTENFQGVFVPNLLPVLERSNSSQGMPDHAVHPPVPKVLPVLKRSNSSQRLPDPVVSPTTSSPPPGKVKQEKPETPMDFSPCHESMKKQQQEDSTSEESEIDETSSNDDWCAVCSLEGELLCCDTCPRVFHLQCHVPCFPAFPSDSSWSCGLCQHVDWKALKQKDKESIHPGNKRRSPCNGLTEYERKVCEKILLELFCHTDSIPFQQKVNRKSTPTYYKVIKHPMDLSNVRAKLQTQNVSHYQTFSEFVSDCRLIFDNCAKFNKATSEVGKMGSNLEVYFDTMLKKYMPDFIEQTGEPKPKRMKDEASCSC